MAFPTSDLLIHTGDFTDGGSPFEIVNFGRWLGEKLIKESKFKKGGVFVVAGNHDTWGLPF